MPAFLPHIGRPLIGRSVTRSAAASPCLAGLAVAVGLAALAPNPAAAQSATIDPAQMQSQLRTWFSTILAPAVTLPEPPLTVTREGDTYLLTLPASLWSGAAGEDIAAELRPIDGGAWTIEKLRMPLKGQFSATMPNPSGPPEAFDARYQIGEQSVRGVIDPGMRRRSSVNADMRDMVLDIRSGAQKQLQRLERYGFQASVIPGADGRFDVTQDATMNGWETSAEVGPGTTTEMGMRRGRVAMRLEGVRSDRLGSAFAVVKDLIAIALNPTSGAVAPTGGAPSGGTPPAGTPLAGTPGKADAGGGDIPEAARLKLRELIEAFRGLADRMEAEETLDDLIVTIPVVGKLGLSQFAFGMGAEVPDGRLRAWTELSMSGLQSDMIPPAMRDYVPSRVAMRPVISGVPTDRIFSLMLRATESNPDMDALLAEATTLLSSADTVIGVESMAIDLDPVKLSGTGRLRLFKDAAAGAKGQAAPELAGIEARLTATGLDALMAEANKKPELRQALPFIAMARGMGRQEGDKLVWDLAITESQALVNGVDLFATPPPPEPKPQPRRR